MAEKRQRITLKITDVETGAEQPNQQLMFLSDGGDTVRDLQMYLSPESEHWLDWFHITMHLTMMGQYVKGSGQNCELRTRNRCRPTGTNRMKALTLPI